jgi:predicted NUDIX family phosphoesterase
MASIVVDEYLYPANHPYHWPTIGSMADLSAASFEDVVQFFRTYYAPNNASLSIAGDIDIEKTKALVEKWFDEVPRGKPVPLIDAPPVYLTEEKRKRDEAQRQEDARRRAEEDSTFKQIIPYCVVRHKEDVLLLRRLKTQGEKRLHNKLSIGVGGHINPVDVEGDLLELGCEREMAEEIAIGGRYRKRVVGFINDDATAVGSVHFGVVYRVDLEDRSVQVREAKMMEGSLTPIVEVRHLAATGAEFETWSSLVLSRIDDVLAE